MVLIVVGPVAVALIAMTLLVRRGWVAWAPLHWVTAVVVAPVDEAKVVLTSVAVVSIAVAHCIVPTW